LKRCLVPTLKRDDVVAMDNLPVHRVASVAEAIEAAGATILYLLPYSPDLNLELAFSKSKTHLCQAAEHTIPGLDRPCRQGLQPQRVQESLSPRRLCSNMTGIRSSHRGREWGLRHHRGCWIETAAEVLVRLGSQRRVSSSELRVRIFPAV